MGKKVYSSFYRLIHWLIAITMLLLLLTIVLRMTWLNKANMSEIITSYAASNHIEMSKGEVVNLAREIREPMWIWHIYFGYTLLGLFVVRILAGVFTIIQFQNPFSNNITPKVRFQRFVYIVFYLCIFGSLVTGLMLEFGITKYVTLIKSLHKASIYYFVGFLVLHFLGILIAEFTYERGIVSRMINGRDKYE
ncbi:MULTISPECIES: cytochrome b/b6 domain-containing protein [Myroides]|uniref:Cytochrome b/b6 domain-containing protein n=1 Tax=Myroides albus TaxID=2562892 RepID=A0A6I3LIC9_9FLAO|nr:MULTISPECIES: cytochrome b/b6 domain-containing protein [Myroides]MTG96920.1 cytochrome b/b6 domain-containing protein [Myroides albus]MVX35387.1 cytochrome b/b6 domain-containing protein [Myroides sp. LoEW2-1]UVD78329.1 cytochrome b/b6 domain-containing protein [Myroides albus]